MLTIFFLQIEQIKNSMYHNYTELQTKILKYFGN